MRWDIEDKVDCELWFFSGISFGGTKRVARIHAYGGLQGDEIPSNEIGSLGVIAQPGTRVILRTARNSDDWESVPWRAIECIEGQMTTLIDGRPCVQIPDLDRLDAFDANRTDLEIDISYPRALTMADGVGKGWTYGRTGRGKLKNRVASIRVERIPTTD